LTTRRELPNQAAQPGTDSPPSERELRSLEHEVGTFVQNISSVVIASGSTVRLTIIGLLSEGHLLLEDLPGVGKTLLAKTVARSHA
jgi:MoxR-like ATPase